MEISLTVDTWPTMSRKRGNPDASQAVGRTNELLNLHRFWDLALSGEGQTVLLTGEPGVGKTHLLNAFRDQALQPHKKRFPGQDLNIVECQCYELHSHSFLQPITSQLYHVIESHISRIKQEERQTFRGSLTKAVMLKLFLD